MACLDCQNTCFDNINDSCVKYTGEELSCVGITATSTYPEIVKAIVDALCLQVSSDSVTSTALSCVLGTSTETSFTSVEAITKIIDYVCSLDMSNIITNAPLYCLASGVSVCDASIVDKSLAYTVTKGVLGSLGVDYDYQNIIDNLPAGYTVNSNTMILTGTSNGAPINLTTSTSTSGSVIISAAVMPATLTFEIDITTPCGNTTLVKAVTISSSTIAGSYATTMSILGYTGGTSPSNLSQDDYNEILASAICSIKLQQDSTNSLIITECASVPLAGSSMESIVGSIYESLCVVANGLENIGVNELTYTKCNGKCDPQVVTSTLSEALTDISTNLCDALTRVATLESQIATLTARLDSCCPNT